MRRPANSPREPNPSPRWENRAVKRYEKDQTSETKPQSIAACRCSRGHGCTLERGHPGPRRRQEAQHPLHHGRRRRLVQHRRLSPGHHVRQDAEPRQAGLRRACGSPTTTPRRAARRAAPTSSPARFRCAPGLTTVGQAGADVGIPAKACTLATALKAQGYATGQFGKNHLGDLNKFLPTRARLRRVLRLPVPPRRDVATRTGTRSRSTRPTTTSTARAAWCTARRPTRTTRP